MEKISLLTKKFIEKKTRQIAWQANVTLWVDSEMVTSCNKL